MSQAQTVLPAPGLLRIQGMTVSNRNSGKKLTAYLKPKQHLRSEISSAHNKKLERMHRATASTESKLTAISTQLSDVESRLDLSSTVLGRLQLIHL